jgi:sacsin
LLATTPGIYTNSVKSLPVANDDSSFDYTWIDLSENHEYVSIANLPAVPTQTGVTFIDVSMAGMEKLARTFGLAKTLSVESLLRDYVLPAIEGKSIEKVSEKRLIEFILEASAGCSNEWRQTLAKARVIPSRSLENTRDLRAPRDLYDPTSRNLQRLFFMDETVFPDSDIFKTYHILLKQCGLHTEISSDIIKSRIRYFEKTRSPLQELEDKVSYLVQTPLTPHELRDKAFMIEVQSKRWVPAFTGPTMVKLSPKDCRPSGLAWLVSQTHGLVRFSVSPSWHQLLGWDKAIDFQTLLKQLSKLIEENKVLEVQKVLDYIEERCSPEEYVPELTSMRCIPGSQGLYVPSKVFSSENRDLSRLSPHVDILHPAVTFSQIQKNLGVQGEFTLETLLTVQECILTPGLFLSNQDLDVAVAILHLASSFPRDQLADLMGPTQDCKMVNIAELTIGGDKERLSEFQVESLYFVHDRVSLETLSKLQIDTLRDRMIKDELKIDEEDDDEYTPQEELTTVLSDCLRRYPPATAFNEYVANAEDCRASKLAWTIDDCEACTYPTERLMTKELECVQGPSLFVYNDGVFSEADFEGFKQIGRGSKSESETSIGMYGRGAITMYHFTDVPMILSGSTFLILDPQQTLLPRNKFNKRKVGVKVSLTRARRAFPDHLVPFEGLWGYTAATDHFNGTIFRFPFRIHSQVSSLVDGAYFLTIEKIKMLLEKYFKTAQVAMLFLKNVRSLCYRRRADEGHRWYVQSIPEPFSEKNLIQKMIIKSWDLDKSSYTDHWLIATHDNNVPAQMVTMDIPSKLRHKKIQCGVAACPASTYKTEHSIFCTLPTAFTSSLPVSFHGIFAITGDRQTIPHGDTSRGNESQWNKWLLAQCIPQLYLGFLQETCKRWPDLAYRLWPNGTVDETSKVVRDSFWAMLGDKQNSSLRLFPLVSSQELIAHGNRSTAVSLHDAQFEFLQDNSFKKLKPLLLKLFPKLVKLPANLHGPIQQLIKSGKIKKVAYLSEQYLCEIFQDEDACEKLKTDLQVERKVHAKETWINLMNNMIPASNLNSFAQMISVGSVGCRILPTRSGKLGKLMPQCNSCAATTYLRGTINETEVFSFAGDLFVDNEFEKPIVPGSGGGPTILSPLDPIISSGLFNVRKMEAKDAGGLLKHADSPLTNASPAEKHRFLFNFWEYFNPKLTALLDTAGLKDSSHKEALEQCGFEDMPIYATGSLESPNFIAPADFDDGPYMLEPSTPANRSLCEKIPGLQLVHRFLVPKALREAEMDICSPPSFKRFIRCLMRLTKNDPEAIEEFVATNLKHEQLKV